MLAGFCYYFQLSVDWHASFTRIFVLFTSFSYFFFFKFSLFDSDSPLKISTIRHKFLQYSTLLQLFTFIRYLKFF